MVNKIKFLVLLLTFLCIACIGTSPLKDGYTKVPNNHKLFENSKFNKDVFKIIDTNYVYIDTFSVYRGAKSLPKYSLSILRFYPNGLYNRFEIDNNSVLMNTVDNVNLNFKETGSRGYYYYKDNELQLVSFGPVNELYTVDMVESKIILTNDNLLKQSYPDGKISYYYKKMAIPEKWKNTRPNSHWE